MSRLLLNLLGLEIAGGLLLAGLFIYAGTDYNSWPQLVATLLPVFLCITFYFRLPAAYSALATYSGIMALCGVSYVLFRISLPEPQAVSATGMGLLLESVICVFILTELMKKSTKDWFRREK